MSKMTEEKVKNGVRDGYVRGGKLEFQKKLTKSIEQRMVGHIILQEVEIQLGHVRCITLVLVQHLMLQEA